MLLFCFVPAAAVLALLLRNQHFYAATVSSLVLASLLVAQLLIAVVADGPLLADPFLVLSIFYALAFALDFALSR